jgi:predicted RNase H-like HicB family nuclease
VSETARYPKHVFWSSEDEGFIAIAPDLPGSSAFGATEAEALAELDHAIDAWIEAARAAGNAVPAPSRPASASLPSGKVLVRMPKGLHQRAARCAEREDVSLNQFIVACVAEAVGERSPADELVRQVGAQTNLLHELGLWLRQNIPSTVQPGANITASVGNISEHLTTGHAVTVYDGTILGINEWRTAHTSTHFDPISTFAKTKQDYVWNMIEDKFKSNFHARD